MKIKKTIKEAAERDDEIPAIKPQDDSVAEIADDVQDTVETASSGTATLSDDAASKVASEIKSAAVETGSGQAVVLPAEADDKEELARNALTDTLDAALKKSRLRKYTHEKNITNVLVCGLPGSGKTAITKAWAKANGINLHYIDAKNPDLEIALTGMMLRDVTAQNKNVVAKAYSNALAPLHRPNSVLFLDEYNRQTKDHIRASLLSLLGERVVEGSGETGYESFEDTLLFTVACINPSVPTDRGAADLNDAEMSRFAYFPQFDSTVDTTLTYIKNHFGYQIKQMVKNKDALIKQYKEDGLSEAEAAEQWRDIATTFAKEQDLFTYIVTHPTFEYDSKDDLETLADGGGKGLRYTMLNQRSLTNMILNADGDKAELLEYLRSYNNQLMPKDTQMLIEIVESYTVSLPNLLKNAGIADDSDDKTADAKNGQAASAETDAQPESEEDDADFFTNASTATSTQPLPADIQNTILDIVNGW